MNLSMYRHNIEDMQGSVSLLDMVAHDFIITPLIMQGIAAGLSAIAPIGEGVDEPVAISMTHRWPPFARTRCQLLDAALRPPSQSTPALLEANRAYRLLLLRAADQDPEASRASFEAAADSMRAPEVAAAVAALAHEDQELVSAMVARGCRVSIAAGRCIASVAEGSVMISDSAAPIRAGTIVSFAARGLPWITSKVLVAWDRTRITMHADAPRMSWDFWRPDLLHVEAVTHVADPGGRLRTIDRPRLPSDYHAAMAASRGEALDAPRHPGGIAQAWCDGLLDMVGELRKLPERANDGTTVDAAA